MALNKIRKNFPGIALGMFVTVLIMGCAPEVGSEAWCKNLKQKPKGEWTANEVGDFTKHCVLK